MKSKKKIERKSGAAVRVQRVVRPSPPDEQEISDKRDDAAQAAHTRADPDAIKYAEGVRDALAWVIGDDESPSV